MAPQAAHEMSSLESRPQGHEVPLAGDTLWDYTIQPSVSTQQLGSPHLAPITGPSTRRVSSLPNGRCYDRPGKKPAADLERDPIKLHDKICRQRGDGNFATDWILIVFKYGVTMDVLIRVLTSQEITAMNFAGGFEPRQVYDGFITKVGDYYECGLCKEDKKTYWKAKKNAPRHLRKFHFGLADVCETWYAPPILNTLYNTSLTTIGFFL